MTKLIELTTTNMTRISVAPEHILLVREIGTGSMLHMADDVVQVRESYEHVLSLWKEALDDKDDHRDDQTSARTGTRNKR